MHPLIILAAFMTAATAQLTFTDPDPNKPLNFLEPSIYIAWTVPPESKYAPLNATATLYFKGPQNLEYLVSFINTGVGITGQTWTVKDFVDTKNRTFTSGKDYYFELQFSNALEGTTERTANFTVEGVPKSAAGELMVIYACGPPLRDSHMADWDKLPMELRQSILKLAQADLLATPRPRNYSYAAVCREWQFFFESWNFRRLTLSSRADIQEFRTYIPRHGRRRHLQHVWLRMVLPRYSYSLSLMAESASTLLKHAERLSGLLTSFADAVRSHGPPSEWARFALEISVHSPMDRHYWFRQQIDDSKDIYPHRSNEECSLSEYRAFRAPTHDPNYDRELTRQNGVGYWNWRRENGRRITSGIERLVFPESCPRYVDGHSLPPIYSVKELVIRRQALRRIELPALTSIASSLQGIEAIRLEPWRPPSFGSVPWTTEDTRALAVFFRAIKNLRLLSIFEDFNQAIHDVDNVPNYVNLTTGAIIADGTRYLRHFSGAFYVEAAHFFQDFGQDKQQELDLRRTGAHGKLVSFIPKAGQAWYNERLHHPLVRDKSDWWHYTERIGSTLLQEVRQHKGDMTDLQYTPKWPHLETIALTSYLMHPDTEADEINSLLVSAARGARRMPNLKTLEIWNGGRGFACVFLYTARNETKPKPATITLSCSWGYDVSQEVVKAWAEKAGGHCNYISDLDPHVLTRKKERLDPSVFNTHGSVVGLLELRRLVLHPVSLAQLQWEAENDVWSSR
ncbi:hypothetical protein OQA88_5347 [Cercophora sp. LCS_1]